MRGALSGTLVSADYAMGALIDRLRVRIGDRRIDVTERGLQAWWRRSAESLGPASPVRAMVERSAAPLFGILGYTIHHVEVDAALKIARGLVVGAQGPRVGVLVVPWGDELGTAWREAVRHGLRLSARWCLCFNGTHLRIVDGDRCWARSYLEFHLEVCAASREGAILLCGLAAPDALTPGVRSSMSSRSSMARASRRVSERASCLLDEVANECARQTTSVCSSLCEGVRASVTLLVQALARCPRSRTSPSPSADVWREEALTIIYRILFLLYAEARLLVPLWHPVYRTSYSIEGMRDAIEREAAPRGLWETLQAISRLAREGCRVDRLIVPAFNGQLFAASPAPLAERCAIEDRVARQVLYHLTTAAVGRGARRRISYADLGVEQLGAVYEHLLDDLPSPSLDVTEAAASPARHATAPRRSQAGRAGSIRKSTGTFYTPRCITDYLVRRTLHPLVNDAAPERILQLRVLDPAMGSGAFLVAACRYLASAYERAIVRTGQARGGDISERDRARFRRSVAQSCLFGVDVNARAVQLARLSLWLATLAADAPLTFLDHRLRVGDSLVGADPADLARQPPGRYRGKASAALPLFDPDDLLAAWQGSVPIRHQMATISDDSVDVVKWKDGALRRLEARSTPLGAWRRLADLWCAVWFWTGPSAAPAPAAYAELCAAVRGQTSSIPRARRDAWLASADEAARRHRFFHWTLEFPEVFVQPSGLPRDDGGFDALIGNPPWDMVRADSIERDQTPGTRQAAYQLVRFVREAGIYGGAQDAHVNRYQLFVERALALLRRGGRLGLVVPWGLFSDHGSAALRRRLLERTSIDALVSFENARGIFPIHRSVRFAVFTTTCGGRSAMLKCRLGERDAAILDRVPDGGAADDSFPIRLTAQLLDRVSGERLAVPDLRHADEVVLLDRLMGLAPPLGAPEGWGAKFSRDLNASDDRCHFIAGADGLAVVEGKHLAPFVVDPGKASWRLPRTAAESLLPGARWQHARLAYRDVASAANRITLIAAVLPAQTVSTHTVFCLRTPLAERDQWFLCGLLNSFVLNWLARLWVGTHLTVALVERLPAPRPAPDEPAFDEIARLARRLGTVRPQRRDDHVDLQARVATLYGLTRDELRRILEAFPLVDERLKRSVVEACPVVGDPGGPSGN